MPFVVLHAWVINVSVCRVSQEAHVTLPDTNKPPGRAHAETPPPPVPRTKVHDQHSSMHVHLFVYTLIPLSLPVVVIFLQGQCRVVVFA